MRLFFAVISLLFITFEASADFSRKTTFEDRLICANENKGVWREFGDVCADECNSKFDQFKICSRVIEFSCDCGVGRCWKDKKCALISDERKIYEANLKEEKERNAKAKEGRLLEAERNAQIITDKLVNDADTRAMSIDIDGADNNYADFYNSALNDLTNNEVVNGLADVALDQKIRVRDIAEDLPPIPEAPPIVIENDNNVQPTPFFAKQEESKRKMNPQIPSGEVAKPISVPQMFPLPNQ